MINTYFIVVLIFTSLASSITRAVTFDWAVVGNPGNAGDAGIGLDGTSEYGSVDYIYRISKHEVTNAQYTEFLNSVDAHGTNSLALYSPLMSTAAIGGITLNSGAANGFKYGIKPGRNNNPVGFISFFDAMRFVNWLQNGQGSGSTEHGVYTIGNGQNEIRNPNARYFIPSEDEWYKSAYHKNDGVTGNYWDYPTSSDTAPYSDNPTSLNTPNNANVANHHMDDGVANGFDDGFAVTGTPNWENYENYATDVGAYSQAPSPYGTFDQGGNVWEWNEDVITVLYRGVRGGSWTDGSTTEVTRATHRSRVVPSDLSSNNGFRVASIPEPTSLIQWAVCFCLLMARRRR